MFTETLALPETVLTESHVPPDAAAVKVLATPLMLRVCATGAVPPIWNAKESEAGLTVRVGAPCVTFKVTGTVFGLPLEPAAVIVTEPL